MRTIALTALILSCPVNLALAEPLPPVVAARVASDEAACVSGAARLEKGFITRKDVNGDKIPDYILDYSHLLCGPLPDFCGSAGCAAVVFASHKGSFVKVVDDQVGKLYFERVNGKPAVVLVTRGDNCGKPNTAACFETRVWNGNTFKATR